MEELGFDPRARLHLHMWWNEIMDRKEIYQVHAQVLAVITADTSSRSWT